MSRPGRRKAPALNDRDRLLVRVMEYLRGPGSSDDLWERYPSQIRRAIAEFAAEYDQLGGMDGVIAGRRRAD